ncbi:hypothetical protein P691DRAFT_803738 [Macrolepiota fuliginosa MF-IS2]|uniref:GYF domain-containing protein n=1 Tax=Macrolepiota fuliginosa MF-IS2 TaxID=1400762 RepID=A0A9P5XLI8_9AGAR|nr:hypothetical protein P691DRAFT_803738 [Macrolepiota fuliginosa MF-IS2]
MAAVNDSDDRSSDLHVPLDPARFAISAGIDEVQVQGSVLDTAVVEGVKIATEHVKENSSPLASSRGPSLSTNPDQTSDAVSVHSMPAVHISESAPPLVQRPSTSASTPPAPRPSSPPAPAAPQSSVSQQEATATTLSQQQRRARHRSAIEVRSSNRLSGFFNNLIHRREPPPPSPARDTIAEDQNTAKPNAEKTSRPSSPAPAPAVNPPPSLPPPSLQELGLSLSVVTSDLSPTHFTTPPASGAFLAPHYLLLCHAQGLDVLPLVSPPALQPYALVRRVAFKSVVVMEHRGVLVAIAGRRDGVRVYALEEVKKAIEWRIDVEIRRERERLRRETTKRIASQIGNGEHLSGEKVRKTSLSTPPPSDGLKPILRKASHGNIPYPPSPPPPPLVPRAPRTPTRSRKSRLSSLQIPVPPIPPEPPLGQPPPYTSPTDTQPPPNLRSQPSALSVRARARSNSVNHVLAGVSTLARNGEPSRPNNVKSDDWDNSSDDEAIDIRAAASGSQALDERTSATLAANRNPTGVIVSQTTTRPRSSTTASSRRRRPSNLDLPVARGTNTADPEPSPAPTLLTLRQALQHLPPAAGTPDTFDDGEDEDETDGRISLAQALMESRVPELPPLGSVQPQEPILLSGAHPVFQESSSPRSSEGDTSGRPSTGSRSRRHRGWSVMLNRSASLNRSHSQSPASSSYHNLPQSSYLPPSTSNSQTNERPSRSPSLRTNALPIPTVRSASSADPLSSTVTSSRASIAPSSVASTTSRSSRFIPRIISNALSRRSDDRFPPIISAIDADVGKWLNTPPSPPPPPPKLEYVKLPGTKSALLIKAVETPKKSFLAILCGENGEKVELFAGTYRTALGLSRTFILPDSPRSLELQLQGDDLVEVFLVFSQNVFGLEPATVRVREVRIGRAERRAARRRARENRTGESTTGENEPNEEETTNVNVSIGVSVTVGTTPAATGASARPSTPPLVASEHPDAPDDSRTGNTEPQPATTLSQTEDSFTAATSQMGPYTTFQQLSFAPNFPLASIADEYIIPPTYPDFLEHRDEFEQGEDTINNNHSEHSSTQFSPPGLPVPTPSGPTQWYYKDPKGVMHGPWNSTLMQAWYRDGLLPADLPVRREGETEYTLLKDLKMQCVDPAHPFRSPPPLISTTNTPFLVPGPSTIKERALLAPVSLLSQPKHFGPPALFFSSRGGHSTAIVDTRGRSVLKGRFVWSNDDCQGESKIPVGKMGDVKHLEALNIEDRAVLIAMRQGGLEALDLSDALLRPADQSRTTLPSFHPPSNTINRRSPYVWKIGTPIDSSNAALSVHLPKGKTGLASLPKKTGIGITKSTMGSQGSVGTDGDGDPNDEVLFLGRREDEIYFCERNAGSFRILRLCPDTSNE